MQVVMDIDIILQMSPVLFILGLIFFTLIVFRLSVDQFIVVMPIFAAIVSSALNR